MTIYKDRFYHANNAEDRCIIGAVGWPIEKAELWNARTLPTDQDKRGYDALIEDLCDAINEGAGDLAKACLEAISTLLKERDALRNHVDDLQQAEFEYRLMHDRYGAGASATGRAWDLMKRAGDKARAALSTTRAVIGECPECGSGPPR
jgi:hypothetical protein